MADNFQEYTPEFWLKIIEKIAGNAKKGKLHVCDGIWITQTELSRIASLNNKVLERLSFTLLCLAKLKNIRNQSNNNWVNNNSKEIFEMACVLTSVTERDLRLNQLKELGLIKFAKKITNLNIQVLFVDNDGPKELFINDFRKLGNEWRLYKGENYIRCQSCGILTKNNKCKTKKYCKNCSVEMRKIYKADKQREYRNFLVDTMN